MRVDQIVHNVTKRKPTAKQIEIARAGVVEGIMRARIATMGIDDQDARDLALYKLTVEIWKEKP